MLIAFVSGLAAGVVSGVLFAVGFSWQLLGQYEDSPGIFTSFVWLVPVVYGSVFSFSYAFAAAGSVVAILPLSSQLITLLTNNNRIDLLAQVATAYLSLIKKHQGKETAIVTTAVALSPDLEKVILAKSKEMTSAEIRLENKIDPSIMGGFILRIGDMQYNASVAYQLEQLKRELIQTNYSA